MADIKKIDIKGEKWDIKDEVARGRLETLEKNFGYFTMYSETEMNTNQKWIDGKDIYRKVISGISYGNGNISAQSGITNIDQLVNLYLIESGVTGTFKDNVFVGTNRLSSNLAINLKTGVISVTSRQSDIAGTNAIFVIEYTKL